MTHTTDQEREAFAAAERDFEFAVQFVEYAAARGRTADTRTRAATLLHCVRVLDATVPGWRRDAIATLARASLAGAEITRVFELERVVIDVDAAATVVSNAMGRGKPA